MHPLMKRRLLVAVIGLVVLAVCAGWLVVSQLLASSGASPAIDPKTPATGTITTPGG